MVNSKMVNDFDDIRPYYEEEIPAAMQRLTDSDAFPLLASYVYPGVPLEEVRQRVRGFKTVREFQSDTMYKVNEQVIERSMTAFSGSGLEHLDPHKHYLYVSNHRDIMLDASLLQYFLLKNGFDTSEITFGANLMTSPTVIDIGKSNKMFRVERPVVTSRHSTAPRSICRNISAMSSRKKGSRYGLPSATDVPRMVATLQTKASSRCSA